MSPKPAFAIVFLLAGCAAAQPEPPVSPTVTQIASRGAEYRLAIPVMTPSEYLQTGVVMVRDACLGYFDELVRTQDKLLFASREGSLLGSVGVGAAAASGAGAAAMAALGLASMAAQGTIANAQISGAAGVYPEETAGLIMDKAMGSYLSAIPSPQTIAEADMYVHGLAALCSSTKIHQLPRDAISSAQTAAITPAVPAQVAVAEPPSLFPPTEVPPLHSPRRRFQRHAGTLTPPSAPPVPAMPRAYPPSLVQRDIARSPSRIPPAIVITR